MTLADIEKRAAEASAYEEFSVDEIDFLLAEIQRLRGLIKKAEWESYAECMDGDEGVCPWCHVLRAQGVVSETHDRTDSHYPNCPAFTESGEVK